MAVIIKKIKNKAYAYLSVREGLSVRHYYLGREDEEKVIKFTESQNTNIPYGFKTLFWDTDFSKLKLKQHSRYIIERVLEFGDIDAVNWMQKVFSLSKIIQVIMISRNLSEKSKNFWEGWFGIAA